MSYVLQFFSFLWRAFDRVSRFIISMPGMIVSGVVGFTTTAIGIIDQFNSSSSALNVSLDTAIEKVSSVSEFVSDNSAFCFLSHVLALDVLWETFTSSLSFCIGIFGFVFWVIVVWGFQFFAALLCCKLAKRVISFVSAGFINP